MAAPGARRADAAAVHPDRRGIGPHHRARPLGAADGVRATGAAGATRWAAGAGLRVAVNVSGRHLQQGDLVRDVAQALESRASSPATSCIELTESTIMHNTEVNLERLRELKALGVRLAIDDFGIGLLVAVLPAPVPDRHPEDRSLVRQPPGDRGRRPGARARGRDARRDARPRDDCRRHRVGARRRRPCSRSGASPARGSSTPEARGPRSDRATQYLRRLAPGASRPARPHPAGRKPRADAERRVADGCSRLSLSFRKRPRHRSPRSCRVSCCIGARPGDVAVRVAWSDINFKDALAVTGAGKVMRRLPLTAGIDLAGVVTGSADERYQAGDPVIVVGCGLGEEHDGGYATSPSSAATGSCRCRLELTLRDAMAIGTAGLHRCAGDRPHGAQRPAPGGRGRLSSPAPPGVSAASQSCCWHGADIAWPRSLASHTRPTTCAAWGRSRSFPPAKCRPRCGRSRPRGGPARSTTSAAGRWRGCARLRSRSATLRAWGWPAVTHWRPR